MKKTITVFLMICATSLFGQDLKKLEMSHKFNGAKKGQWVEIANLTRNNQADCGVVEVAPAGFDVEFNTNWQIQDPSYQVPDEPYRIPHIEHILYDSDTIGTPTNPSDEQVWSTVLGINQHIKDAWPLPDGRGRIKLISPLRGEDNLPFTGDTIRRYDRSLFPGVDTNGISPFAEGSIPRLDPDGFQNAYSNKEIANNEGLSGIQGYSYTTTAKRMSSLYNLYVDIFTVHYDPIQLANVWGITLSPPQIKLSPVTVPHHECGHNFMRQHTFESTCSEVDCTSQGDYICETLPFGTFSWDGTPPAPTCEGETAGTDYHFRSNMSYWGQKDRFYDFGVKQMLWRLGHQYMSRSYAAIAPDSCDMGKPYGVSTFGTVYQGGVPVGTVVNWKINGYQDGWTYPDGTTWKPKCRVRGRKLKNDGTWTGYAYLPWSEYNQGNLEAQQIAIHPGLVPNKTYQLQVRCSCNDTDPNIVFQERTPWSDPHQFVFAPTAPVANFDDNFDFDQKVEVYDDNLYVDGAYSGPAEVDQWEFEKGMSWEQEETQGETPTITLVQLRKLSGAVVYSIGGQVVDVEVDKANGIYIVEHQGKTYKLLLINEMH